MCFAYAIEQALANRIPPASIWLAILPDELNDENSPLVTQYLSHFYQQDDNHKQRIAWYVDHHQLKNKIIS